MKTIFWVIVVIVLVVLVGTWPLSILGTIFDWIGTALKWLAGILDFFNWNGLV